MDLTPLGVAAATGITVHQLRLWERRYGFPTPQRAPSGHRRYNPADVDAARLMRQLIAAGVPGEVAARTARERLSAPAQDPAATPEGPRSLLTLIAGLDARALPAALAEAFAERQPEAAFDEVVAPLLRQVGDAWEAGDLSPAQEHFATLAVLRAFERSFGGAGGAIYPGPILIACPAGEEHDLPAALLSMSLEWHGHTVVSLGANVPGDALLDAARAVRPVAACLVVTADSSIPATRLAAGALIRAGIRVHTAGRALSAANPALPGPLLSFTAALRAFGVNQGG
ncbi:MAG: MerR family transcriptional regulator [Dehalococcoidia bacterium]